MGDRYNKNMDAATAGPVSRWFDRHPKVFIALLSVFVAIGLISTFGLWPLVAAAFRQ